MFNRSPFSPFAPFFFFEVHPGTFIAWRACHFLVLLPCTKEVDTTNIYRRTFALHFTLTAFLLAK